MSTKQSAIDAVAEAIYNRNPASVSSGRITWTEAVEDWPEHVLEARANARAAILAYLSAIAEDEASVEAVAMAIYATSPVRRIVRTSGLKDSRYHDVPYSEADYLHEDMQAASRATFRTLLSRAKEQQG